MLTKYALVAAHSAVFDGIWDLRFWSETRCVSSP